MKRKDVLVLLTVVLAIFLSFSPFAAELPDERLLPLLVDDAELLTSDQKVELLLLLESLSESTECDIAVVTVNSLGGENISDYTDDFYDYNGYGQGENYDGIMLLISMREREVHISDCGYVLAVLSQSTLDWLRESITPSLSNGDYYTAFKEFAERSAQLISNSRLNGNDSDYGFEPDISYVPDYGYDPDYGYLHDDKSLESFFDNLGNIPVICIVVGIIGGFIAVSIMKGKLKSVRRRNEASDYVRANSLNIAVSNDMYLYKTVRKTPKPKDTSSSSGGGRSSGGSHSSSSGRSHGGSSGRF